MSAQRRTANQPPPFESASGSSWDRRHLEHLHIDTIFIDRLPIWLVSREAKIDDTIDSILRTVDSRPLIKTSHSHLLRSSEGGLNGSTGSGTMAGPFLAALAMVLERPKESEIRSLASGRSRRETGNDDGLSQSSQQDANMEDPDAEESDGSYKDPADKSYSDIASQTTEMSEHIDRTKPELTAQMMLLLFLQLCFEASNLGPRGSSSYDPRHEWKFAPHPFFIRAGDIECRSINDGSLVYKSKAKTGFWITDHPFIYCSVEAKARFHNWDDDRLHGTVTECVNAQEASQLVGMMCQRLEYLRRVSTGPIDPRALSEHDRTTFLISCSQRSMFLKYARFEPSYISTFLSSYLIDNHSTPPKFSDIIQDLKQRGLGIPSLRVHVTREYDLSSHTDRPKAAELVLQMGAYVYEEGPIPWPSA